MFRFPSARLCRRAESVQAANTVYVTFVRCRSLHLFPQTLCSCRLGRENVQPNFDLLTINSVVFKKMFFCRPGFDEAVICNGLPFFSRQSIIAAGFRIFARRPFVTVYFFRPWQALIMPVFLYFWIFSSETANFLTVLFLLAVKNKFWADFSTDFHLLSDIWEFLRIFLWSWNAGRSAHLRQNIRQFVPLAVRQRNAVCRKQTPGRKKNPTTAGLKNAYSRVKKDAWSKIIKALTDQKRKTA